MAVRRAITVDTGLRLSRYFGMNDAFWTGLQMDYDTAMQRELLSETLTKIWLQKSNKPFLVLKRFKMLFLGD